VGGQQTSPLFGLLPIIIVFGIFYLMLFMPMRRRQKKHQALLARLAKGDRIVTSGGIFGTIVSVDKDVLELRIADNVKIQVARNAIAGLASEAPNLELKGSE
jgi:preprotein translocase subunit YajC